MLHPTPTRTAGERDPGRLRERLLDLGLIPPRRRTGRTDGLFDASRAARLRRALEEAGPVARAFGAYLATRVDLLSPGDCAELSRAAPAVAPLPDHVVRARLEAALGRPPAETFESFDETPLRASAFYQWHAARLVSGEAVVVKLRRPEWDASPAAEVEELAVVDDVLCAGASLAEAREDFSRWLERLCDLRREASELERLALEQRESETWVVPRVFEELASARLLVTAALDGRALAEWLPTPAEFDPAAGAASGAGGVARRVCAAWFHQALLGRSLPEEPQLDEFLILPGERLALTGVVLRELDDDARRTLREHVSAASREEPDAACLSLLRLTRAAPGAVPREELLVRLRQADPFRSGQGFERYQGPRLAHTLFTYWRLARESGYAAEPELAALVRGTAALERLARRLAPSRDALAEGLADVRLVSAAVELRELLAPSRLTLNVARYLPPLLDLLQRAERLQGGAERRSQAGADAARQPDPWGAFFGRLAMVIAGAWLAPRALGALLGERWGERLAALVVLAAGALLLAFLRRASREAERTS